MLFIILEIRKQTKKRNTLISKKDSYFFENNTLIVFKYNMSVIDFDIPFDNKQNLISFFIQRLLHEAFLLHATYIKLQPLRLFLFSNKFYSA